MNPLFSNPVFGVATTVLTYAIAQAAHHRWRLLHPLVTTCVLLIAMLLLLKIPYDAYRVGGDIISFFLGPATIALGVPFYKNARRIGRHAVTVSASVIAGSAVGIISAGLLVYCVGGSTLVLRSMLPKSVTTPISIELSRQIAGAPELTAVFTVLAGLIGSVIGPRLLRLVGVRHDIAIGLAIGTSSHGIGTARLVRENELQAGTSGLAMALAGIVASVMMILVQWWFMR